VIISKHFFRCNSGLSGAIRNNSWIGGCSDSYAVEIPIRHHFYGCLLAGEYHRFELPEGANRPEMKDNGNVFGCGLVLDPDNKLTIFFTLNGQLVGKLFLQIFRVLPYSFRANSFRPDSF
jgi:hypothetical protein